MRLTQCMHFSERKKKSAFVRKERKTWKVSENTGILDGTNVFTQVRSIFEKETGVLQLSSYPKGT